MDLDALRFANFKLLDEAVSDWSRMVDNLDELKEAAGKGLSGAAKKANWAGYNATVSREFIGKTAAEFDDALTQARTIWKILRDTRDELRKHSEELVRVIAAGSKKNLTVKPTGGGGFTVSMNVHPDRAAKGTSVPDHGQRDVDALRDDVQRILDKATESDTSASMVLQAIADQSTMGFSDASYSDRDGAVAAVKEADALSKLAKKNPSDLSVAEFDRLNAGLKKYADDELFSERFATNLGAKGTLEFWADINDPSANPQLNHARHEKFDDLQKNLSLTLATATQSDSLGMTEWTSKVVDLGNRPVGNSGPMGFQVMSNLMRWGNFDDQFLTDYGSRLMAAEKERTANGEGRAWQRTPTDFHLNRTKSDTGWDPLTGYLKSLSNSPDAATGFFNDKFVSAGSEDNPFGGKEKTNFQYLFEERNWPIDVNPEGERSYTGRNNLALALEAATTGHPAGELLLLQDRMPHNAEQTKLMENLVSSISEDSQRLTDHPYLADSVGQIASEYLPDINRAITDDHDRDTDRLFPLAGSEATLSHRDVTRFLFILGQSSEGYAAVEVGQKSYMANLMDYHMNPDLPDELRYNSNPEKSVEQIARGSGEISGTLAMGRQEAVAGPAEASDKAYGESVSQWKNAVSGGIGTGIGVGTAYIASPITGAAVGGAASTASSMVLESLFKDAEGQAKPKAGPVMGERWENGLELNNKYSEEAAENARRAHHRSDLGYIGETARIGAMGGYQAAGGLVERMAADLHTVI
ncbi:hypothetical protein ACH4D5_30220 [Streptomyces sp. NPDC018029]|uniref:hypothetical protein n=1 Tax=Streptomyces sp. NPDC018029 TaxID=3365032 RepID=UPI0037A6BBB5